MTAERSRPRSVAWPPSRAVPSPVAVGGPTAPARPGPAARSARYLRTVRQLRAAQVAHRVRLRSQQAALARWPGPARRLLLAGGSLPAGAVGWPPGFTPYDGRLPALWPDAAGLAAGTVDLLGTPQDLTDWTAAGRPRLLRYHLHYWDWCWGLAAREDRATFERLWHGWRAATRPGHGDAWSPYVVSLRAWTFCGVFAPLVRGGPVEAGFRADLAVHRAYLRTHVERDVGGNHLIKNLKALLGLAVFAGDRAEVYRWAAALRAAVDRQVLADGGHYERSPAYHCQVLADLADATGLLAASGTAPPAMLLDATARMRHWLAAVLGPDGTVPLLNDGYPLSPTAVVTLLEDEARLESPREPGPSGLAVLRSDRLHVIADVGPPCPDDLPAHAHADSLSFLLWVDRRPVVVDPGTSTYEPGPRRAFERSTAAHATVTVDGADSTEVWGTFRAGRRARTVVRQASLVPPYGRRAGDDPRRRPTGHVQRLAASHDGYRWLPGAPLHARSWVLDGDRLVVTDRIAGRGVHRVESVLPLAPGLSAAIAGRRLRITGIGVDLTVEVANARGGWGLRPATVATGWERREPSVTAVFTVVGALPVELRTTFSIAAGPVRLPTSTWDVSSERH